MLKEMRTAARWHAGRAYRHQEGPRTRAFCVGAPRWSSGAHPKGGGWRYDARSRMNERQLLGRLRRGHFTNVGFDDFTSLIEAFGFELERVSESHHIFRHHTLAVRLNLQTDGGQAKPYQLRQFLRAIEQHGLRWRGDED